MPSPQSGILAPVPSLATYLMFSARPGMPAAEILKQLPELADGESTVVGVGESLVRAAGAEIPGLRTFPALTGAGVDVVSTPGALWFWLRGEDRGDLLHRSRAITQKLARSSHLENRIDAFRHGRGLDLTGYEDGTENPVGDAAVAAAIVQEGKPGMTGSSYVAVQQWVHDLEHFHSLPQDRQDQIIGRRKSDNEELGDAPASAHVKRTAQEDFEPPAFVVRRSMPWTEPCRQGLVFVAFGKSLDAFEALLQRMVGADDGIVDGLFSFTRPITGATFWCPPLADGCLDLAALGL